MKHLYIFLIVLIMTSCNQNQSNDTCFSCDAIHLTVSSVQNEANLYYVHVVKKDSNIDYVEFVIEGGDLLDYKPIENGHHYGNNSDGVIGLDLKKISLSTEEVYMGVLRLSDTDRLDLSLTSRSSQFEKLKSCKAIVAVGEAREAIH